jgi:hypothetical protein
MKIHCAQLVEGALRSALDPQAPAPAAQPRPIPGAVANTLLDSFSQPKGIKISFLEKKPDPGSK